MLTPALFASPLLLLSAQTSLPVAKLTAPDGSAFDRFGSAVAVHGDSALIGAWGHSAQGSASGSAYLIHLPTGTTTMKLTPADGGEGFTFGTSVALGPDLLAIGAPGATAGGAETGAVYLFDRATGKELEKITPPISGMDFGRSVSLHENTLVVGAPFEVPSGAVYVYGLEPLTYRGKIQPMDASLGSWFGLSVAVNADTIATINSPPFTSFARFFRLDDLSPKGSYEAPPASSFGSIALTQNVAVVGNPTQHVEGAPSGAAHLLRLDDLTLIDLLVPADLNANDGFGTSVDASGPMLLVGAPQGNGSVGSGSGKAYVFDAATGAELGRIQPDEVQAGDSLGRSVALHQGAAMLGAPLDGDLGPGSGSAYFADISSLSDCNDNGLPDTYEVEQALTPDCNLNGIPDACDIESGLSLDQDDNGIPDECGPAPLTGLPTSISVATGGAHQLTLTAGPEQKLRVYFVLGSASGTSPGTPVDGLTLPLNTPDPYFGLMLSQPNSAAFNATLGVLDAGASASAAVQVPMGLDASFVGLTVRHAYVVFNQQATASFVSNSVMLRLAP